MKRELYTKPVIKKIELDEDLILNSSCSLVCGIFECNADGDVSCTYVCEPQYCESDTDDWICKRYDYGL